MALYFGGIDICVASGQVSDRQESMKRQIKLHHETYGSGRPILMLHGFGASTYTWRYLIEPLSNDHKLFLLDLKGFGKSPKPKDRFYRISDQADLVYRFILENDLRSLTIVGHSLGGAVALLTAIKLADEKQNRLSSLVLIDSAGYKQDLPAFIDILRTPVIGSFVFSLLSDNKKVRMILKKAYFDDTKITQAQIKAYSVPLDSPGGEQALFKTAKKLIPPDINTITKRYKEILVPTLIVWGREDQIVPLKVGKKLQRALPKSEFVVIEKCGHIPHEEKPEETIRILSNFLNTHQKNKRRHLCEQSFPHPH